MDFITKLPVSGGFDSIMVVIDLLSKVTHFIPVKETYTAEQLAQVFRSQIFKLHGMPEKIISDRGSTFVSEFALSAYQSRVFYGVSSSDQRTNGTHEPGLGGLSLAFLFILSRQLGKNT
jgi:hypothetical protein